MNTPRDIIDWALKERPKYYYDHSSNGGASGYNEDEWEKAVTEYLTRFDAAGDNWISVEKNKLIAIRDALARNDYDEAYHQLYSIVDPNFEKLNPWEAAEGKEACTFPDCDCKKYREGTHTHAICTITGKPKSAPTEEATAGEQK